ncbi:lysosomal proton-coupled steroid conjugate and bile acid symporter SLC46A3 [Halyomorpha halys]|uniref:lysosomal proton-coupled steroid conjugate and bile acid symporter SLC46A3 n=1 Tax=Halyomorpha halys TaxID=286706 RepID=UPI0006D4FB5D|nr:uncharacterized protein LOC106692539 [Halyomorpha halys]
MKTSWYEFSSEPAVFLYTFSAWTYSVVIRYFLMQKTCSPDVEPPLRYACNDTNLQIEANELMAIRNTWFQLLSIVPLLVAGCARDATGLCKPMMYVGVAGEAIGVSIQLFSAWSWRMSAWSTAVSEAVVRGIAGGGKMFYLGAACVVTERSKPSERVSRLTLNLAAAASGACLASTFSRHFVKHLGYQTSFISINVMFLLSLLLVIFIFEDRSKLMRSESWQIFGKLMTLFKSRSNGNVIWLMVFCSALSAATTKAEENLFWNYMIEGFGFSFKQVGYFQTYQLVIRAASSLSLPLLLFSFLKNSGFKIGIICSMIAVISSTAMGFAGRKPELLLIALLDFSKCFLVTIPLSVVTRCVNDYEIGIYLSLCYVGQSLLTGGFFYGYDAIFAATIKTIPGTFYLVSASVAVVMIILYRIALYIYVPSENENEDGTTENETDLEKCGNCFNRTVKF